MKGSDNMFPMINKKATGINLRKIMDERGITVKDVQHYLGLASVQSIYHWLNGISMPTIDNLYALSELFKLPIDAMVCGNRQNIASKIDYEISNAQFDRLKLYYTKISGKLVA